MDLSRAAVNILKQLGQLLKQIDETDFATPSQTLSQATVGQHIRHTLEFFICFQNGFRNGLINYDNRAHDKLIETDKFVALKTLGEIIEFVKALEGDEPLKLEVGYTISGATLAPIDTTCRRELVYNIEHAVHHMALIKIGVREVAPYVDLSSDFGVASSTILFNQSLCSVD